MNANTSTKPVIVVGAGPVGCTAAHFLVRSGIPVVLLESEAQLNIDMRASTFHPPSLDMLDRIGVTEKLLPLGLVADKYQYRDRRSGLYAEFDLGVLSRFVKHPFRLQCEQWKLTQVAVDMLKAEPLAGVRMATRITGLSQDADGVTVELEDSQGSSTLQGSFVIGCDGARSVVRKAIGVEFEGFTYPELFLVISTDETIERHFENLSLVNYISDAEEWCTILRVPSAWRVLFPTDPDADPESLTDPDALQARMQRLAPQAEPHRISHTSLYRIHQRVAKSYRVGRVLLAGDAAHLNNPLGGMGMNGGLHDVVNLCDKLDAIVNHGGSMDLLDLYDRQRRITCVDFVQSQTMQNKKAIEERDEGARLQRIRDLQAIAADPEKALVFLSRNNMIDSVRESYAIA